MLNGAPVVRPYWGYERAKKSSLAQAPPPERVAAKRALEGIHDDAEASRKKRATGDGPSLNPPSPLSLDGAEATPAVSIDEEATEDDADIYQPEASRPTLKTTGKPASTASASRKASHSVIERRRRERINETLAKLSELVPGCRAALEAKDAKSSTRSRRKSDRAGGKVMMGETALNVGGLHKLDVLLATVEHIEWLHKVRPPSSVLLSRGSETLHRSLAVAFRAPLRLLRLPDRRDRPRRSTAQPLPSSRSLLPLCNP